MIAFRPYTTADRAACLDLWQAASRVGHPFLGDAVLTRQRRTVGDVYLPGAETILAEDGGMLAGFIGLLDGGRIGGLFVDPARHGQGVGAALVSHAAARKGPLTVEVYEANRGGRAFYARMGFRQTGRRETDDEGLPHPLLVLSRPG